MIVFNADLDNTIIFSYKHSIGENKRCAEVYQGREISFITEKTFELLQKVWEKVLFVPTTTRTAEQYNRINLGTGSPKYALVCNGGVLLIDGEEDNFWYEESLKLIAGCKSELRKAEDLLKADPYRSFEVRNIRELFVFTKSSDPVKSVENLKKRLNTDIMNVFSTGIKVYAIPKMLSKGSAVERFRARLNPNTVIAAGDSEFDISMLEKADISIAPKELTEISALPVNVLVSDGKIFSEFVLKAVLDFCEKYR